AGQPLDGQARRYRAGVARLADDPHEAVLRDSAGCPAMPDFGTDPVAGAFVIDMVAVQQGYQDVDVKECALHATSSSRSLSMSALDTASPRCGRGWNR